MKKKKYSLIQKIKTKLFIIIFVLFIIYYLFSSKKIEEFNKSSSGGICENDLITFECENYSKSDVLNPPSLTNGIPKGKKYYKYNTELEKWEYIGGQSTTQILNNEPINSDFDCPCDFWNGEASCNPLFQNGIWKGVEGLQESCSTTCGKVGLMCDSDPWEIKTEEDMIKALLAAGKDPSVICSGGFDFFYDMPPVQQYSNSKNICYYDPTKSVQWCNNASGEGINLLCKCK